MKIFEKFVGGKQNSTEINKNLQQWVETNPSNIRFFPTDICFYLTSWYYANGLWMSVCGCSQMLDGLVSSHPICRFKLYSTVLTIPKYGTKVNYCHLFCFGPFHSVLLTLPMDDFSFSPFHKFCSMTETAF